MAIKSLQEVLDKIKEVEDANKANAPYPYSEDEVLLQQLYAAKDMYEQGTEHEIEEQFYSYYKVKYGPYISAEARNKAKAEADKYLNDNLRKTRSESKRAEIWKKYEEMRPPDYSEATWSFYKFLAWICNEGELYRPVLRSEVHQAWCALAEATNRYLEEHPERKRK